LIEAAWAYRHPARVTRIIATRQTGLPKAACDIAWKAQLRLSTKYRRMNARHLHHNKMAPPRSLSGNRVSQIRPPRTVGRTNSPSVDKESHINVRNHQRALRLRASGALRG
jgi:hypothetical protein